MGLFKFLKEKFSKNKSEETESFSKGMEKSRENFANKMDKIAKKSKKVNKEYFDELEEILIEADVGVNLTMRVIEEVVQESLDKKITDAEEINELVIDKLFEGYMNKGEKVECDVRFREDGPTVLLVAGVNGVGKTTSVGKLASIFKNSGKKVLIAAADTYRAAATEQLKEWADRAGTPIIAGKEGADPASVIYDAVGAFKARNCDILIVDTAGRLHNKKNLMEELAKVNRIIDKELPGVWRENFIVLDGTTGQNALNQAKEFGEAANLTGIILTKLDGTAKGGIAVAIVSELNIPVKYIGVGEGIEDLQRFDSNEFVNALFM